MKLENQQSNRLYLVTGVAGNLGGSVAAALLKQEKNVRGLVLKGDPAVARVQEGVELCEGDITDTDSLDRFFTAVDSNMEIIVIHCAAIVALHPDFNQKVYDVNYVGTKNIINACVSHNVKKLVYVSSISAIPELPHGKAISEVKNFNPDVVRGYYGKTKAMASQAVFDAVQKYDLDASIVFPTGIFGPGDYAFGPVVSFIINYCAGKAPVGLEGSFNAVDSRDLANAIISCCDNGGKGEGYILGNECVTMKQMFHILSELTSTKEVKIILPAALSKLLGRFSDIIEKITGKPMRLTSFTVYNLLRNNVFDCEKARRELGFHTRPFADSIRDIILWLKSENKI